jgi:hypothetical protein
MSTNSAPLVAYLFLYYYERDFMLSLSEDTQQDVIVALQDGTSLSSSDVYFVVSYCFVTLLFVSLVVISCSCPSWQAFKSKMSSMGCYLCFHRLKTVLKNLLRNYSA